MYSSKEAKITRSPISIVVRTWFRSHRNQVGGAALLGCLLAAGLHLFRSPAPKSLRVGYSSYVPYIIPRRSGPPDGFAAAILARAAERAGIPITWVPLGNLKIDEAFARGVIDLYPLLTITEERKKRLHLSQAWWENNMVLISLESHPLPTAEATRGKLIATRGMLVAQQRADVLFAGARRISIPDVETMLPELCSGAVDGIFLDLRLLQSQLLKGESCPGRALRIASMADGSLLQATAASRAARPWADKIFEQVADLSADGTLSELAAQWSLYNSYEGRHMKELLEARQRGDLMRFGLAGMTLALVFISLQTRRLRRARSIAETARLEAEENRQRFDAFMRHNPAAAYIKDAAGRMVYVNESFCRQFETEKSAIEGYTDGEIWSPEEAEQLRSNDLKVLSTNRSAELTESVFLPSGEIRHFLSLKFPFENRHGQTLLGAISVDITERKRAEEALRFSQFSIDHSPDSIFWIDPVGHVFYANDAASQKLGYSREELTGMPIQSFDPEWTFERFTRTRLQLKVRKSMSIESTHFTRDGRSYPVEVMIHHLEFKGGEFTCCMARDITDRKRAERELSYQASHDLLTDLPNRRTLEARLAEELNYARCHGSGLALICLDLDSFKLVNDTLGHHAGDTLLKQVAARLRGSVAEPETLARMGGDEFVLVLKNLGQESEAQAVAQRLLASLRESFDVTGHDLLVTASAGISIFPRDGATVSSLLQSSDAAMYESKRGGKNRVQFFTPEMGKSAKERLELENHLRRAQDRNELSLDYQPQVSLTTGRIVRYEALLRWNHPSFGSISPAKFIPIAEETSLIVPIGAWVLEEACRHACSWMDASQQEIGVGVNVSVVQFLRPDFVETVRDILRRTGLPPRLLELEITETVVMHGVDEAASKIERMRDLGVSVSIDDFGTGYSSLGYLQRLPIDNLKIDRAFIRDIAMDPAAVAVTASLVSLAHSLGMTVVIEGIETRHQLELVTQIGFDIAQGYLLGNPAPVETVLSLLSKSAA